MEPEKIHLILEAAGKAPSGGNTQPWEFVVITDASVKTRLHEPTVQGLEIYVKSNLRIPENKVTEYLNPRNTVAWMAENTDKAPILILACLNTKRARRLRDEWAWLEDQPNWASVFPAVQNPLVAARALGLGTAISIFSFFKMAELRELLIFRNSLSPAF